ncbi:FtsB family cell division protein [Vagococcus sp.]|uniref:FtsB family cell division protein n=1 Tax=Vagococcus sp. TaxID=1933889 RepID=UPI003F992D15
MTMKKESGLLTLEEKTTKLSLDQTRKETKSLIFKRRRIMVMAAIIFLVFSFIGFNLFQNSQKLLSLRETKQEVNHEYKKTSAEQKELQDEVNLLHDQEYMEKVARSKYFYSKEGEQVYSIPELNNSTQTSGNK